MFDTEKVRRMTTELQLFARERDTVYIIPEWLTAEVFALFRRVKLRVGGIIFDSTEQKNFGKVPILKSAEAFPHFNEHTGLIILARKAAQVNQIALDLPINGQLMKIPAFVMESSEALAIYDRLTILRLLQQYQADGLTAPSFQDMAINFARGLTTFLDPDAENIKIQLWDRNFFKAPTYDVTDTAIVLRGQVVPENRYTAKTLEFYRMTYPNTPLVVSTWKNELTDEFRAACKKFDVILLGNTQPAIPGDGFANYQLENAFKGVRCVKEKLGTKFVLVTRTDQRLNRFDFLLYLRNLALEFPPLGDKLRGRILTPGFWLTTNYLPFSSTDFFAFGFTDDLLKFYDLPNINDLREHKYFDSHRKRFYALRETLRQAAFRHCDFAAHRQRLKNFNVMIDHFADIDIFWMKAFYRRHIAPLDGTKLLETWRKFIREYLLFVDSGSLLFDWSKYEDPRRYTTIVKGTDFAQWLGLYRNFNVDRL